MCSSGADIKSLATEAGLLALRERRMRVTKKVSPARWLFAEMLEHGLREPRRSHTWLQDFDTARERVLDRKKENTPEGEAGLAAPAALGIPTDASAFRTLPLSARWFSSADATQSSTDTHSVPLHPTFPLSCGMYLMAGSIIMPCYSNSARARACDAAGRSADHAAHPYCERGMDGKSRLERSGAARTCILHRMRVLPIAACLSSDARRRLRSESCAVELQQGRDGQRGSAAAGMPRCRARLISARPLRRGHAP